MLNSRKFKIKMLNIDSTRNHLKIIEVCFKMLRQCAHTHGTLEKKHHTTSSHMELKSEMECIVHVVEQWMNISMWNNMES